MQLPQRNDLVGLTAPAAPRRTATSNAASHHLIHIFLRNVPLIPVQDSKKRGVGSYGDVQRFFAGSRETIRLDLWSFSMMVFR